jgi:Secretion system C-terminal sorting domain
MKQFYTLALALTCLSLSSSAQTYPGGTYTVIQSGNWHTASGPGIWQASEPPAFCSNCNIVIPDGVVVTLNADVTLAGTSLFSIGTASGTTATTLVIPFSSSVTPPTPFPIPSVYNRISLIFGNAINLTVGNSNDVIDASRTGPYDGIFMAVPTPQGNSPYSYIARVNTTAAFPNATSVTGPNTLNAFGDLPIILSNFTATLDQKAVNLDWTTQLEMNSSHFVIQSSTNAGASWNNIATVAAHGNSAEPINYSFTDSKPATGTSEYRLQMVDLDGKYAYSAVKVVRIGLISSVSIYPNPARDYVNVVLSGDASVSANIRLINQAGQLLMEKNVSNAGGTTVAFSVSGYPQGNYLIIVTGSDGTQQVNKVFISK